MKVLAIRKTEIYKKRKNQGTLLAKIVIVFSKCFDVFKL